MRTVWIESHQAALSGAEEVVNAAGGGRPIWDSNKSSSRETGPLSA